ACLRQFQNALIGRRIPMGGDAAAREGYHRTGVGVVLGQMWSSCHCAHDTRGHRLTAVEDFDVNPLRRHTEGRERFFHVCHEASRPAEVNIRVSWNAGLVEDRSRQVTRTVEILAHCVARAWPAVTNITGGLR